MTKGIEMFQDMSLIVPEHLRAKLRAALIKSAVGSWRFDAELSQSLREAVGFVPNDKDALYFCHDAVDQLPAAALTLWETNDGYEVLNIVPTETEQRSQLSHAEYNSILVHFKEHVVDPIASSIGVQIKLSSNIQFLEDWTTKEVANCLKSFSGSATKPSGGASDQPLWFAFVVASHHSGTKLGVETLCRWLHEAEGWSKEWADKLAIDYETQFALLAYYDEHRAR